MAGQTAGDGGPRVVRSQETPFALPFLKVAEAEQVLQANRLLLFCLKLFLIMTHLNKFMMIEHPSKSARDEDAWLASIWKLFATQVYKYHPFVWQIEVMQGYFGSKSPKPTTLLFTADQLTMWLPHLTLPELLLCLVPWRWGRTQMGSTTQRA